MNLSAFLFGLMIYMAISLPVSLMIWAALMMAKCGDTNRGYDLAEENELNNLIA